MNGFETRSMMVLVDLKHGINYSEGDEVSLMVETEPDLITGVLLKILSHSVVVEKDTWPFDWRWIPTDMIEECVRK